MAISPFQIKSELEDDIILRETERPCVPSRSVTASRPSQSTNNTRNFVFPTTSVKDEPISFVNYSPVEEDNCEQYDSRNSTGNYNQSLETPALLQRWSEENLNVDPTGDTSFLISSNSTSVSQQPLGGMRSSNSQSRLSEGASTTRESQSSTGLLGGFTTVEKRSEFENDENIEERVSIKERILSRITEDINATPCQIILRMQENEQRSPVYTNLASRATMAKPISTRGRLGQVNTISDTHHNEFSCTSVTISGQRNFEEASTIIEACKFASQATISKPTPTNSEPNKLKIKCETHYEEFGCTSENDSIRSGDSQNAFKDPSSNDGFIEVNLNRIKQENTPRETFQTLQLESQEWRHQCSSVESSVQETSSKISNDHSKGKSTKEIMREKQSNPEFRIKENEQRRQIRAAMKNSQVPIAKQMSSKLSQVNIKSEPHNGEFSGTSENVSILNGGLSNFEHPNFRIKVDSRQIIEVNFKTIKQENTPRESDDEEPFQIQQHESQEWNPQCSSVESSIHETSSEISKVKSKREIMREKRSNPKFRIKENERKRLMRQRKRQDPNYLERERERQKLMQRRKCQDPNYLERKRERQRLMQRRKRQDPNYRERDRERLKLMQWRKRQDPNYREKERERRRLMQRLKREDPAYVQNERIKNRLRQQLRRQDPACLQNDRIKNRLRQQLLRQDLAHLEKKK